MSGRSLIVDHNISGNMIYPKGPTTRAENAVILLNIGLIKNQQLRTIIVRQLLVFLFIGLKFIKKLKCPKNMDVSFEYYIGIVVA